MNIPKLRFKEFDGEWKEKKLAELYQFKNGLNKEKEAFGSGTPIVNYMDVNKNTSLLLNDIKGKVQLSSSEKERFTVKSNDLFFTRTSETSDEIGLTSTYIGEMAELVFSGFILKATPIYPSINSLFYSYYLRSGGRRKEIIKHSSITTRALTSGTLLSQMSVAYPLIAEQKKIADFFTLLDKRVQKQQEKVELLKDQKKGHMQKLFSQELRFKDEHGNCFPEWESIRLTQILKERKTFAEKNGLLPHATLSKEGIYLKNARYDRDFLVRTEDKKYKITKLNDICYNPANLKFGVLTRNKFGNALFSPIYVTFEVDKQVNPIYLEYYFCRPNFINKVRKFEEGTVYERMAVKPEDFLKFEAPIPSKLEQQKIAEFLYNFECKINTENAKLEALQEQKKVFMQQMFV